MRILLIILLLATGAAKGHAQTLAQTTAVADSLYRYGQFGPAAEAYRRVLYFDTQRTHAAHCARQLAWCEAAQRHFPEANLAFDRAWNLAPASEQNAIILEKAAVLLAAGKSVEAIEELLPLRAKVSAAERPRLYTALGAAWFALDEGDSAFAAFRIAAGPVPAAQATLDSLERRYHKAMRKRTMTAYALSMGLPGLGQLYAGDLRNAANSAILIGSLATAGLWMALTVTPLDAILTLAPWLIRYYMGGAYHAERLVDAHKQKRKAAIYARVMDVLAVPGDDGK